MTNETLANGAKVETITSGSSCCATNEAKAETSTCCSTEGKETTKVEAKESSCNCH
ncbi:MAG: hypothetical protein QM613_06340 [Micrococcaceae bacterium]